MMERQAQPSAPSLATGASPASSGPAVQPRVQAGPMARRLASRWGGSSAIWVVTALLFVVSWVFQPQSLSHGSLFGMLPFAAVLAMVSIGQTLVIQQRGIDLSVPGMISLTVVIASSYPNGDASKLGVAIAIAYGAAVLAGLANGLLVSVVGITPIVATIGMNALLYGSNLAITGGVPRNTTAALESFASGTALGVPTSVVIAVGLTAVASFIGKRTVLGRRFEAVGSNPSAARAAGLATQRYQVGAYVAASVCYCSAGILLAGLVTSPSAFQGDTYLLPSVASVVLGGTSLLGGKGSVVASTMGALFLSQLGQFVLTTGLSTAVESLIEAVVLALGIAIYTVRWSSVRDWIRRAAAGRSGGSATGG
ncbi:MAG TPA: ABC transporter permease [Chloroflexota bacterium]|nr:ABC transporter permease [Chloroflexota bacterium]